jgi:alpha-glucosidase
MLLLTLRGTPTHYYGDELGMRDVPIPHELVQDPFERNVPGIGVGRDPERTPMQWSQEENAGFTTGKPWLPVSNDHVEVNVEAQGQDPRSMLSLHRRLLALRRAEPALAVGSYAPVEAARGLLAYSREKDGSRFLIALNLGSEPRTLRAAGPARGGQVILSTFLDREDEAVGEKLDLRGNEGLIVGIARRPD